MKLGSLQEKKWVSVVTSREGCGLDRRASCRKTMVSGPLFNLHEYFLFKIFNYACAHTHTEWHQNPQAGWSYDSAVLSRAWGICIFSKLPTHPGDRSTANHTLRTLPAPLFLSWPKKLYIRFSALMAPLDTSKEAEAPGPFAARATLSRGLLVWTLHFTHAWTQDAQRAAIFDWVLRGGGLSAFPAPELCAVLQSGCQGPCGLGPHWHTDPPVCQGNMISEVSLLIHRGKVILTALPGGENGS